MDLAARRNTLYLRRHWQKARAMVVRRQVNPVLTAETVLDADRSVARTHRGEARKRFLQRGGIVLEVLAATAGRFRCFHVVQWVATEAQ